MESLSKRFSPPPTHVSKDVFPAEIAIGINSFVFKNVPASIMTLQRKGAGRKGDGPLKVIALSIILCICGKLSVEQLGKKSKEIIDAAD